LGLIFVAERPIVACVLWVACATSCVTSSLFMTALAPNLLAVDMVRTWGHVEIAWLGWYLAFPLPGIVLLHFLPMLAYVFYPLEIQQRTEAFLWARHQLEALGPLSWRKAPSWVG
jgi:L-tartrate/succinate antiporter